MHTNKTSDYPQTWKKEQNETMESIFLTNRVIRNYLQLFNENKWKEVVKYTLIYGIQSLQLHYNLTQLSTQKLEEIVKNSNFIITAEDLQHEELYRMKAVKSNADYLTSEMGIDPGYASHLLFLRYFLYLFSITTPFIQPFRCPVL